ncbi:MAG TPA: hypothetical protein VGC39_03035, partial [Candidatus Methylacidiphilales bacterium]
LPVPILGEIFHLLGDPHVWKYATVFVPMAVLNVIGSIQNLESAEAAGDKFDTRSSLLANGISAVVGVFFGNPFAPTIYIGHPGWKAMGARVGYSVMNAVAVTLICLTGAVPFLLWFMPLEVTLGILLWIGLIITAQAFQEVPKAHAPAVAIGFIPSLAAWGELLVETTLGKAAPNYSLQQAAAHFSPQLFLNGMLSLAQGFILISIFFSAIVAKVIDRQWLAASAWCLIAAVASACGIIHGFIFTDSGYAPALFQRNPINFDFAAMYGLTALLLLAMHVLKPGEIEQ